MSEIRYCTNCIMNDRADSTIVFDENGQCNYCKEAIAQINTTTYFPNELGKAKLNSMLDMIKRYGAGKDYDCVMGLSGGLDSSYLAYLGYKWGLRILAVHIDDGFDTEISKSNIKKLCEHANIELKTICPDPKQYNALTVAYMRAGVPNIAVPQDNILLAFLYYTAKKNKIKYFLSGGNFALECILQHSHLYDSLDVVNIRDINKRFGTGKIDKLKFISAYERFIDRKLNKLIELRPLNYIDYNRDRAFAELKEFCGFEYYGSKHLENILTAFVQLYWFPKKFGVDKRKSHLSSMIVSGQMTRDQALAELHKPAYDESQMNGYINLIKKNLGLSDYDFEQIMNAPTHEHTDYRTDKVAVFARKIVK